MTYVHSLPCTNNSVVQYCTAALYAESRCSKLSVFLWHKELPGTNLRIGLIPRYKSIKIHFSHDSHGSNDSGRGHLSMTLVEHEVNNTTADDFCR